jgi:zinc-binding alcohol dehydrogenase/oxidoreductase
LKAVVLKDKVRMGDPIAPVYYEDVEVPKPAEGEVLIRLKYAALNRRDVFIRYGAYPGIAVPAILGSDGSGVVAEIGSNVSNVSVGDEVVINPSLHWGDNPAYPGREHTILGCPTDGTYAQYVKVPAEYVHAKPKHLSFKEAAGIPLAGLTAYRAVVTRGEVKAGDTVIIPGIGGGVANFALQIAVAKGANVYVTSSSDEKIENAVKMGAKGGVNYKNEDWSRELKKLSGGADLSIDSIGGDTFLELINLAKPGSKLVSFGATLGPIKNLVMPKVFFKQMDIRGSTMGNSEEFVAMLQLYEEHELLPVIDSVYALEDVNAAHEKMDKSNVSGKIVLEIPE